MTRYSPERKEAILKKMAPPHNMSLAELANQEGISTTTLHNWRKAARIRGAVFPSKEQSKRNQQATRAERRRVKKLDTELQRKEKALAELAALLTP